MNVEGTILMCGKVGCTHVAVDPSETFRCTFSDGLAYMGYIYLCAEHREEFERVFKGEAASEGQPKEAPRRQRHGIDVCTDPDNPDAFYMRTMYCEWFFGPFATLDDVLTAMDKLDAADPYWDYDPCTVHRGANPLPDDYVFGFPELTSEEATRVRANRQSEAKRKSILAAVKAAQEAAVPTVPTVPTTEDTQDRVPVEQHGAVLCAYCPSMVDIQELSDHYLRVHGVKLPGSKEMLH
jgi:hypothetical protein